MGLYILSNVILGKPLEPLKTLLAFTGYDAVGNSNWYIFVIFMMYIAVFIAFLLARRFRFLGFLLVSALTVGFIFWMIAAGKPDRFYNTVILFPLGMLYSLIKPYVDKFFMCHEIVYFGCLAAATVGFVLMEQIRRTHLLAYYGWDVLFILVVILVTMKFQIQNPILNWLGSHVFSIYILQRIPMMFLKAFGIGANHPYIFVISTLVITLFMAVLFDFLIGKLDGLLYRKRKQPAAFKH